MALILSTGNTILIDCGEGTQHQLMKSRSVRMGKIGTVLITHLHGDHVFGLFGMLCSMSTMGRVDPVKVVGPKGIEAMARAVFSAQGGFYGFELQFTELTGSQNVDLGALLDGVQVTALPLKHVPQLETFGFVITEPDRAGALDAKRAAALGAKGKQLGELKAGQEVILDNGVVVRPSDCVGPASKGRRICILQDTCDSSTAIPFARDCDLLVHEATYDQSMQDKALAHGHSTTRMAAAVAHRMRARLLALTHFSSRYSAASSSSSSASSSNSSAKADAPEEVTVAHLVREAEGALADFARGARSDFEVEIAEKSAMRTEASRPPSPGCCAHAGRGETGARDAIVSMSVSDASATDAAVDVAPAAAAAAAAAAVSSLAQESSGGVVTQVVAAADFLALSCLSGKRLSAAAPGSLAFQLVPGESDDLDEPYRPGRLE